MFKMFASLVKDYREYFKNTNFFVQFVIFFACISFAFYIYGLLTETEEYLNLNFRHLSLLLISAFFTALIFRLLNLIAKKIQS